VHPNGRIVCGAFPSFSSPLFFTTNVVLVSPFHIAYPFPNDGHVSTAFALGRFGSLILPIPISTTILNHWVSK
jgi:hypothetical protein